MFNIRLRFSVLILMPALVLAGRNETKHTVENTVRVLWRSPGDISSRNLFYGCGGRRHEPRGTMTFEKEDMKGTNPKFIVRDRNGTEWIVKLGNEARSETAASRLVWASGYFVDEDYFVADLRVEGMPDRLRRGGSLVTLEGARNVRMKRRNPNQKEIGAWSWRDNPFGSTRELNGLRVLMALINNWDLKDINNAIYRDKKTGRENYVVSDLGSSFGAAAHIYPSRRSKDDLGEYEHSKFIRRETPVALSFSSPGRPALLYVFAVRSYVRRVHMEWIGKNVPRADAKWIGEILCRLSRAQIRDAFRAAGYSPAEIDSFAAVFENRIAQLRDL